MLAHEFMTTRKLLLFQPYSHCHTHEKDRVNCLRQLHLIHCTKKAKFFQTLVRRPPSFRSYWPKFLHFVYWISKKVRNTHIQLSQSIIEKVRGGKSAGNWCLGSNPIVSFPSLSSKPVIINLCHEWAKQKTHKMVLPQVLNAALLSEMKTTSSLSFQCLFQHSSDSPSVLSSCPIPSTGLWTA